MIFVMMLSIFVLPLSRIPTLFLQSAEAAFSCFHFDGHQMHQKRSYQNFILNIIGMPIGVESRSIILLDCFSVSWIYIFERSII